MNYCERPIVDCECNQGFKEDDCTQVLCGEPAVMKVRGVWYCLEHGEHMQAFWDRYEAHKKLKVSAGNR
jgi:hypothetical protein